ncbi:MAG: hypothetical protein NC132_06940 [Corallococcus sp.]|nr:hypothetical protein [Corallococcus sp.]
MIYILMNSKANNGMGEKDARDWAKVLTEETTFIDVLTTDVRKLVSDLKEGDEVVVAGGDGTLNHFINDVADLEIANKIYYVKSGSGNDFYRDRKDEVDELGRIALNRHLVNLPVIYVNGITKRFINGIGYGIDGETCKIGEELRRTTDKPINYSKIAIKLLLGKFKQRNATVTVDGQTATYKHVWLAPTMKGRYYGGGLMVAPNQDRFDHEGKVSVVVLYKRGRLGTLLNFPSMNTGKHVLKKGWVTVVTGKRVEVSFDTPCALQIDGEVVDNVTSYVVEVPEK